MTGSASGEKIVITSMGHYHPGNLIPNAFFESLDIGSDTQWVVERTGIESRASVLPEEQLRQLSKDPNHIRTLRAENSYESIGQMGGKAFEVLKQRYGKAYSSAQLDEMIAGLDGIICGTSVPDYDIPANAATIAKEIGVNTTSFDVNSACSSFIVNLHTARGLMASGLHRSMALFQPERYSIRLDYRDKASCILFGDGCAASTVSVGADYGLEVVDTIVASDPQKFDTVKLPVDECFSQNGKAVQKFAITRTIQVVQDLLSRNALTSSDLSYFIGHQANLRMISSACDRLGLPAEKHLYNVDKLGNQGGAGAPCVLSMNWDKLRSGDLIAVAVVGSGLTWGGALLKKL